MKKRVTVQANKINDEENTICFSADENVKQIIINFEVNRSVWVHVIVRHNKKYIGSCLLTHQNMTREIRIGSNFQTTSETLMPVKGMRGEWGISFYAISKENEDIDINMAYNTLEAEVEYSNTIYDVITNSISLPSKKWAKGDFHTHTIMSDGKMSLQENVDMAKKQNLDFFVATDHNVVTRNWPISEDVLVIAGCELTSNFGHCNFLGVKDDVINNENISNLYDKDNVTKIIKENIGNGLLSINHPYLKPWEWLVPIDIEKIDSIEIMNDPTFKDNTEATEKALNLWNDLWNDGWLVAGVGGSDSHLKPNETYPESTKPSLIGDPGTFVYINDEITKENILQSVKKGNTSFSRMNRLEISGDNEQTIIPGKKFKENRLIAYLENNTEDFYYHWVINGDEKYKEFGKKSSYDLSKEVDEGFTWIRVEVRDSKGNLIATHTPIYKGIPPRQKYKCITELLIP